MTIQIDPGISLEGGRITFGDTVVREGFVSNIGNGGTNVAMGVALDSDQNIYAVGYTSSLGTGFLDTLLVKYNTRGTIQWQRALTASFSDSGYGIGIDSSDNIYITGQTASNGDLFLVKYNTDGEIQWQRTLSGANLDTGWAIAFDSDDNVYVAGTTNNGSNRDGLVAKYNSSGTIQWQKKLYAASGNDDFRAITVDGNNNVYVAGVSAVSTTSDDFLVVKYDSSGAIQWQKLLGDSGNRQTALGITHDSSNNIYVSGWTGSGSGSAANDFLIAKYNSSGDVQWQRKLELPDNNENTAITIDNNNNIYVVGSSVTVSPAPIKYRFLIAKYNSSGVIQWVRILEGDGVSNHFRGVTTDNQGNVYAVGDSNSPSGTTSAAGTALPSSTITNFTLAKLPQDGSGIGNYPFYTYSSVSFTDSATTFAETTATLTDEVSTLTDASSSFTTKIPNLYYNRISIPS